MLDEQVLLMRNNAYAQTYLLLKRSLLSYLRAKLDDYNSAEDIVHEAFVKAMITEQKTKITDLNSWIKKVVHNTLVDHYRQQSKMPLSNTLETIEVVLFEAQLNQEVNHIFAQFLRPFVEQLRPNYARPILLKDFEGKSINEIARELNISQSAVKSRLSRGRKKLKDKLEECCDIEIESGLVKNFHPKN